jgi:hypothetical protein
MLHKTRRWHVCDAPPADELAEKLVNHIWTTCTGFRSGRYLFLNDSTGADGVQEFAICKVDPGGDIRQIESITFGWCKLQQGREYVRDILDGRFDDECYGMFANLLIESSEQHGRCNACA